MSTTDKAKKTSKINTWKPKDSQIIVEKNGKMFKCNFEKVLYDNLVQYDNFLIGKDSYINQLDSITSYTNFFINNYDHDNELVCAYLKIKFALDKHHLYNEDNMDAYIEFLYDMLITDTMIEKICKMVEDNYLDDIDVVTETKKKYLKNDKKHHRESLEFTNQHIKILLQISFAMKIMSPALFHYTQKNTIKITKDSKIIFNFYKKLFDIFVYSNTYEKCFVDGSVIKEGITENEVQEIINNNKVDVVKDGRDIFYYVTDNETGVPVYYTKSKINMYNKLFVYVNILLSVQNLVIDLSKTSLIAGNSLEPRLPKCDNI